MHVNARSLSKPPLHGQMFVGRVIVGDQMQLLLRWRLTLDLAQEPQPFDVAMPLLTLDDDLAIEYVERREQRGRAVALVIVRHRRRAPLLQGQPRLRAIQCRDLALLVAAPARAPEGPCTCRRCP